MHFVQNEMTIEERWPYNMIFIQIATDFSRSLE